MKTARAVAARLLACLVAAGAAGCGGGGGGGGGLGTGGSGASTAGHVLRRVTFGPTAGLLARLSQQGAYPYLLEQLQPQFVSDAGNARLNTVLAQLSIPQSEWDDPSFDDLVKYQLARATFSNRQLQERLTVFWDTHFNTDWMKSRDFFLGDERIATWLEWRENDLFRQDALGRFEDLLRSSATSPAMIVYLDSNTNVAGHANENYARELLELHTMGVDNGYTEVDIEEVARCFTGWTVCRVPAGSQDDPHAPCGGAAGTQRAAFHFEAGLHDTGSKTIFQGTPYELFLPARTGAAGIQDGFDLIAHLAHLPQTADFLSRKLIMELVSDTPPPALLADCVDVWLSTGGDVREVVRTILLSPEFLEPSVRWNQVESPLESLTSTARALDALAPTAYALTNMRSLLEDSLNQPPFRWLNPDGYPAESELQLGTSKMFGRVLFNQTIYRGGLADFQYDMRLLLLNNGVLLDDADAIVRFYFDLFFQDNYTQADWDAAYEFLTTDNAGTLSPLSPNAVDYPQRLKVFAAFVASYPQAFAK